MNYYNENDPRAAAWLRELIKANLIPKGEVDTRSITEVRSSDLHGFIQCHFFAGIGGWSYALQLAGWPQDRRVWTGSCPCQPFSSSGKQKGTKDERHLWPVFAELIRQCNPSVCFGEQVASALGRDWLAGIRSDLEAMGYAFGGADLCAASIGENGEIGILRGDQIEWEEGVISAPHIRQRLNWVAYASHLRQSNGNHRVKGQAECEASGGGKNEGGGRINASDGSEFGRLANSDQQHGDRIGCCSGNDSREWKEQEVLQGVNDCVRMEHPPLSQASRFGQQRDQLLGTANAWSDFDLIPCLDGKARRIESRTFPLAHGVPGRVGLLRGYGNAIVPQNAAEFIIACQEAISALNK